MEIEIKKDAVDRLGGLVKISRQDLIEELIESPDLEHDNQLMQNSRHRCENQII